MMFSMLLGMEFLIAAIIAIASLILLKKFKKPENLEGKVVVVTGASAGIGESLAKSLYDKGCRLVLVSRREKELNQVKDKLLGCQSNKDAHIPIVFPLDLGNIHGVKVEAAKLLQVFGHVDILINNAGVAFRGKYLDADVEAEQKIMNVNYIGTTALTKVIAKSMARKRSGHLVYVSSVNGKIATPFSSAYSASKHAMQAQADSIRPELAPLGIKVLCVSPSYVRTLIGINAITSSGAQQGRTHGNIATGYEADYVAEEIVRAIENGDMDVVIAPPLHRFAVILRTICPSLFYFLMKIRARNNASKF